MTPADRPVASIVVVVDYKAGGSEAWDNLRLTLNGLARQDYREPVEFLLVEADDGHQVPDDLQRLLPGLRVVRTAGKTSYDLKNAGAQGRRHPTSSCCSMPTACLVRAGGAP